MKKKMKITINNTIAELRDGLTISKIKKKYKWITEARIRNAILGEKKDNLVWYGGIWKSGVWENGIWEGGIWEKGYWQNGVWKNGIWKSGLWQFGDWEDGVWENGNWINGTWKKGEWKNGIWVGGYSEEGEYTTIPPNRWYVDEVKLLLEKFQESIFK